jgi:hypothetical protein
MFISTSIPITFYSLNFSSVTAKARTNKQPTQQSTVISQKRTFNPPAWNSSSNPTNEMYILSPDSDFHFELLRVLSMAPYEGSDIGESLLAIANVQPGDFESFTNVFLSLAERTYASAETIDSTKHPVSARNALLRASTYFRSADFFTHSNWSDPRIQTVWASMLETFQAGIKLYNPPGRKLTIQTKENFSIPAYFFPAGGCQSGKEKRDGKKKKHPTLILGSGYDGAAEEMWHQVGKAAWERGINILLYEGPGQQTVRREQNKGFIPEWEKVVTPVVDELLTIPEVDPLKIGLLGLSLGGYLAPRAAAFEHRLAAVLAIDGVFDFGTPIISQFTGAEPLKSLWETGNSTYFDAVLLSLQPRLGTQARWFLDQGLWAFNTHSPFDFLTQLKSYNLKGVVGNIRCKAFVAEADQDDSLPGQAKELADMLGDKATYHLFASSDGAGQHCSLGASVLLNQVMLDWFLDTVGGTVDC